MKTIIRYTLLTASRDWLFIGLFVALLGCYGLAVFTGGTALVEQQQMALSYFAGSARLVLTIGLTVFICFHVRRSIDNREIESILSKPLSRLEFIAAYWIGFCLLAWMISIPLLIILALINEPNMVGLLHWGLSFMFEASLMVAFALLAALVLRSAVSAVMACFAFYLVSRLMGFFIVALDNPYSLMGSGFWGNIMEQMLRVIAVFIPRLDLFAKSSWLIYGVTDQHDMWIYPAQTAVYIIVLLGMALFDLKRKQF